MGADIVNLRHARKRKARAEAEKLAEGNRVRFGLTKAERTTADAARDSASRHLDGHKLTPTPDDA
jgi:hypothetical protein